MLALKRKTEINFYLKNNLQTFEILMNFANIRIYNAYKKYL